MDRTELLSRKNAVIASDAAKTARERIKTLFDEGSFIETDMFSGRAEDAPEEGVITGYGTVDGRAVFVFSQDGSARGAFGKEQAKKILKTIKTARSVAAPVVALIDSYGVRLDEGTEVLAALGDIYGEYVAMEGRVLKISAVFGRSAGGFSVIPALSDFVVMTKDARLMLNGDDVCAEVGRETADNSSAEVNSSLSGNAHFVAEDASAAIDRVKELIKMLPGSAKEHSPETPCTDSLNRISAAFDEQDKKQEDILREISDDGVFLPVAKDYCEGLTSGFIKINGRTVAAVGGKGELDTAAMEKAVKMISFADAFNLSILTLCDISGFKASAKEEKGRMLKAASLLAKAYSSAAVPKVTLITGCSATSAGVLFGSRSIGADYVIAWPKALIGALSDIMASVILKDDKKNYEEKEASALSAAASGYIDDVIEPETTRPHIAAAMEMLYGKNDSSCKKHQDMFF